MGLFDFLKTYDINQEVENIKNISGAVLLDVRSKEEYKEGHIPGSINIPVETIEKVKDRIKDLDE